ncbi:MAG TPA: Gfo/Idh/MocA family oxidoreductase, partial [Gaiella sp.]
MRSPTRVGIVGCGVISHAYAENAAAFDRFEIVACADRDPLRSEALAAAHGLTPITVEELLASEDVDIVLNLTPPEVHAEVTLAALEAGKHVYSEKPLAMSAPAATELLELAESFGLRLGCAPDIFLS